ncbi:Rne/Rng family ribonuclease [Clostridium tagluense]|uniref:Rne/Rng family ribonuclease n=1 Tax=Clostridium TaxID=1485 RepID=UPI0013E9735E|nr:MULTISPECIES: Rne/Rng family ribonuclease [Clostridium]MBU3128407.1 Rne/Rng family ribonuclease [Clostridium tagluense]MBW9155087.1 Rne/Rng family ribonuclease [Clostridium tagluense]MBZ9624699.1 Rne/Rng family ribonuclease [Clostridium sp. FP2]MBZ9636144.1 Rne/Rng family ribonuclease [Clostridium sp. FP1]MCB2313181.1 Rne/Rng family ribonuclease [Clostridium tagluense]
MKEIYIERQEEFLRIAIKENNKLKECFIEEDSSGPIPGEIYKGVVKNIVPAIKCAFIDIGHNKDCYMYLDEKFNNTKIKKGDEIIVEILKEGIDKKGAKVTSAFGIAGIYSVIVNMNKDISFSKKINNSDFEDMVTSGLNKPEDVGVMIRTNAFDVDLSVLNDEVEELYEIYKGVINHAQYSRNPILLFSDAGAINRTLRDILDKNTFKIVLNNESDFEYAKKFTDHRSDISVKVELHKESRMLFDYYGIEKEILSLRNHRISLKCGGNIVIDKTEAMYVIDVNSGKNVKSHSLQKTAQSTNIEAADEIARQIRLRNLSGIIIIDFIDIEDLEVRKSILNTLRIGFADDKNKTVVYPFTQLNLVQIARRRRGKSIYEFIEEPCKHCLGKSSRVKLSYIQFLIKNEISKIHKEQGIKDIYIEIDGIYQKDIMEDVLEFATQIGALENSVYVNFIPHLEKFKVESLIFANQIRNLQTYKIYG